MFFRLSSVEVGLVFAFGLALAVGRYESRRTALVDEANAIGTTYLRAQTLPEPIRTQSLERLMRYTDTSIALSDSIPSSARARAAITSGQRLQRELWVSPGRRLPTSRSKAHRASTSRRSTR